MAEKEEDTTPPSDGKDTTETTVLNTEDVDAGETKVFPSVGTEEETTILNPVPDTEADGDEEEKRSHRKRNIIIAAACVMVLVLAACGGGYAYADIRVGKGETSAREYAQTTDESLATLVEQARTLADDTMEDTVMDASVLDDLNTAISEAVDEQGVDDLNASPYLVWQRLDAQTAYDADTTAARTAYRALEQAVDAVNESIDERTLSDARDALQSTVDSATQTYSDSDGEVEDENTRTALKTAIGDAQTLLDDDTITDPDVFTDQQTVVRKAVKKVKESITAKQEADEAAAEAATTSSGSSSSGSSGSSSSGSSSSSSDSSDLDPSREWYTWDEIMNNTWCMTTDGSQSTPCE